MSSVSDIGEVTLTDFEGSRALAHISDIGAGDPGGSIIINMDDDTEEEMEEEEEEEREEIEDDPKHLDVLIPSSDDPVDLSSGDCTNSKTIPTPQPDEIVVFYCVRLLSSRFLLSEIYKG